MVHTRTHGRQVGASLTSVDSEHNIPHELLDAEDLALMRGVNPSQLALAAKMMRDLGFSLTDDGVAKKMVRAAWEWSADDRLRKDDGTAMTYGEYFHTVIRAKAVAHQKQSQVYYADFGDYIKIGYSINVRSRCSSLRIDPAAILATEPGDRELEQMRHQQFSKTRIGRRENFEKSPDLLSHIDMLVKHFGPPRITSYIKMSDVA